MRVAYVTFKDGGQEYVYRCPFSNVKEGDMAVVQSPTGPAVVTIKRVTLGAWNRDLKRLVSIINMATHRAEEARTVRRTEIISRLEVLLNEKKITDRYKDLTRSSREAAKLYRELQKLS